ncbi:helix-turn-helix domain-containing protein [Listeria fleischmannii]|uniref:helix-turn-helix domain-containing protein n=1 Tax=Listeria fleischmannii TaxID=1069827 RepID=UPI001629ADB7|nr:helix-turn-helix transcriptional regulator [Listeria fleischmannii]MBC1420181.1 helix-turn-helix transcriptional regulator [Listeria fleischmannii]
MTRKDEVKIGLVKKGWSQRELARQMDVSHAYLQDILNGYRHPEERLKQIDSLIGTSLAGKEARA